MPTLVQLLRQLHQCGQQLLVLPLEAPESRFLLGHSFHLGLKLPGHSLQARQPDLQLREVKRVRGEGSGWC